MDGAADGDAGVEESDDSAVSSHQATDAAKWNVGDDVIIEFIPTHQPDGLHVEQCKVHMDNSETGEEYDRKVSADAACCCS